MDNNKSLAVTGLVLEDNIYPRTYILYQITQSINLI